MRRIIDIAVGCHPAEVLAQKLAHRTVVMALKVCEATPTMAELAREASCSMILVCCLYRAAAAAVAMTTHARIGPRRQESENRTATCVTQDTASAPNRNKEPSESAGKRQLKMQ